MLAHPLAVGYKCIEVLASSHKNVTFPAHQPRACEIRLDHSLPALECDVLVVCVELPATIVY